MRPLRRMNPSLLHLPKQQRRLHTHAALNQRLRHPKPKLACGDGSQDCSVAATLTTKPSLLSMTKSQANVASAVMAAAPMAEAAVVVAGAVGTKVARHVANAQSDPLAENAQSAASAM